MKPALLFFIFVVFCGHFLFAQDTAYKRVDKFLGRMNLSFKLPKNFSVLKKDFYFGCDAYLSPPIHYSIISKNKNIIIGIYFGAPPSVEEVGRINNSILVFNKKRAFIPDSNYIYAAKVVADTINHKFIYFYHDFLKCRNNADRGAIYVRNCGAPNYLVANGNDLNVVTDYEYKNNPKGKIIRTYDHNKIITIGKDNRGHFELYYLYTDAISDGEIIKAILETSNMLKFKD